MKTLKRGTYDIGRRNKRKSFNNSSCSNSLHAGLKGTAKGNIAVLETNIIVSKAI
jgi:hypothetical protein